jgi:hypothetical protein
VRRARVHRVPASEALVRVFGIAPFHWRWEVPLPHGRPAEGLEATQAAAFRRADQYARWAHLSWRDS